MIEGWREKEGLGKEPCATARDSWQCPNMLSTGDSDMGRFEYYRCSLCGKNETLDWDECR